VKWTGEKGIGVASKRASPSRTSLPASILLFDCQAPLNTVVAKNTVFLTIFLGIRVQGQHQQDKHVALRAPTHAHTHMHTFFLNESLFYSVPLSVYVSNAVSLSLHIVCVSVWMVLCVTRIGCTKKSQDQLRPQRGSCGRVQRGGVRTVRLGQRFDRSHLRGIGWRYVKKVKFKSAHFFKVAQKNSSSSQRNFSRSHTLEVGDFFKLANPLQVEVSALFQVSTPAQVGNPSFKSSWRTYIYIYICIHTYICI